MIQRCKDGSYVVLATAVTRSGREAFALRLSHDGTQASVARAMLTAHRRWLTPRSILASAASAAASWAATYVFSGSGVLGLLIAALAGVAVSYVVRDGQLSPYLSGACEAEPSWEAVGRVVRLGRREFMGREYNVFSVSVGGVEYVAALTDDELRSLGELPLFT